MSKKTKGSYRKGIKLCLAVTSNARVYYSKSWKPKELMTQLSTDSKIPVSEVNYDVAYIVASEMGIEVRKNKKQEINREQDDRREVQADVLKPRPHVFV